MRAGECYTNAMKREAKIVHDPNMRGGDPTIINTRITVTDVIRYCWLDDASITVHDTRDAERRRMIAARMRKHLPHLTVPQVETALLYWDAHQDEITDLLREEDKAAAHLEATLPHAF